MSGERVVLYYRGELNGSLPLEKYTQVETVNVDEDIAAGREAEIFTGGDESLYPVLRIGGERVLATVFNPSREMFARFMGDTVVAAESLPKPVIYHVGKCEQCERLKYWLTQRNFEFETVNIDEDREAGRRLGLWAGGKKVAPSVDFPGRARLFDPPLELMERLVGGA